MQNFKFINNSDANINQNTIIEKFPFLPDELAIETLKCQLSIQGYIPPLPPPNHPPSQIQNLQYTSNNAKFTIWNVAFLNTSLSSLLTYTQQYTPAILAIQETKLTSKKSPKYILRLFSTYKLIFNNTHTPTQHTFIPRIEHLPPRGGLLILIHNKYAFPNNITKIHTPSDTTPYLQIIQIHNQPLHTHSIIHLYMPSHDQNLHLIPIIETTIIHHINKFQNNIHILCRDFNRDLTIHHNLQITTHTHQNLQWQRFTQNLNLTYIQQTPPIQDKAVFNTLNLASLMDFSPPHHFT